MLLVVDTSSIVNARYANCKLTRRSFSSDAYADEHDQLSKAVERHDYQVVPVRVDGCLHLKTAVSALDEETVVVNPDWIDAGKLSGFKHILVAATEPFAANCLVLNDVVHLSAR